MRTFNTDFITEKNKVAPSGPTPINLIEFGFDTPVYLSDRDITIEATVFSGLVKQWGFIDSSAGQIPGRSIIGQIESADLGLTIVNSELPRFSDHATSTDPIEGIIVTLYQWFEGLAYDEKEIIFVGVVGGQPQYNELEYRLTIKGIWKKYNRVIGEGLQVTEDDYPGCAPDDVGKIQNITYGNINNAITLAVDAGAVDNLSSGITAGQSTIPLVSAKKLPTSGTAGIGIETFTWSGKSGDTLTGCSARTSSYSAGVVVFEDMSYYRYQLAGHPVKSIDDVYVDGFLVNVVADTYTGQSGDELAGYSAQAMARIPSSISRALSEDLLEANGMSNADAIVAVASIEGSGNLTVSDVIALFNASNVDQGAHAHAVSGTTTTIPTSSSLSGTATWTGSAVNVRDQSDITKVSAAPGSGLWSANVVCGLPTYVGATPTAVYHCYTHDSIATAGAFVRSSISGANDLDKTGAKVTQKIYKGTAIPTSIGFYASSTGAESFNVQVFEMWVEVHVSGTSEEPADGVILLKPTGITMGVDKTTLGVKGGTVTRTGITNLSGNSVAAVEVGGVITGDGSGWRDDGSGTITGTPNALIERPDHVYEHLLTNYCDFPSASIGGSFATSGTFFNSNSYTFSTLINQLIRADALLLKWAVQCRSRFFVSPSGVAELIVRQLGQASGHSIPKSEIKQGSMSVRRSAEDDIVNTFSILWNRDLRMNGSEAYQGATAFSDATSVSNYGQREPSRDEAFHFDAVILSAMVDSVGAYFLSFLKDSRALPSFAVFLDNMEIEPGDIIDVTHPLDDMDGFICEVLKIKNVMGSARRSVLDRLEILAVEN